MSISNLLKILKLSILIILLFILYLKKKRNSERDIWRRSWESGHSHSSTSLQSSTTNNGSGTGKDEFWAALQTNYNYIMDTNLLDSCREARGEIEGNVVSDVKVTDSCEKVLKINLFYLFTQ